MRGLALLFRLQRAALLGCVAAMLVAPPGALANHRTYVANCANTYYLELRPSTWSNGCTGGAVNVERLRWRSYRSTRATARGRAALRRPCGDSPCYEAAVYRAPATISMLRPRTCTSGTAAGERFFSRVLVRIRYGRRNPFGERPGWRTRRFRIRAYEGVCEYAP